jgi:PEP-CTERM motif
MRYSNLFCIPSLRARNLGIAVLSITLIVGATKRVEAVPIMGLFNTGVDGTGTVLPAGTIDPHYTLIHSDDPAFPSPAATVTDQPLPGSWIADSSTSQWISPNPIQFLATGAPQGNAAGTFIYDMPFDLTGINSALATISGSWAVDDIGLIYLNGVYVGGTTNLSGPGVLTPFTVPTGSSFTSGINHLDFVVVNAAIGSTGLRVEGLSGSGPSIPEPSTVVLAGLGFIGLAGLRLRRGPK